MRSLLLAISSLFTIAAFAQSPVIWRFDSIRSIGGNSVSNALGNPRVIQTDLGPAVHFDGTRNAGDALYLDTLPLTGALSYTWEVVFRPASNGGAEQRFFHLQETGTQSRRLFETRIVDGKWCLDAFATNEPTNAPLRAATLLNCDKDHLFPLDQWYTVAAIYDGSVLRSYVNGQLQTEKRVNLEPLRQGGSSIGTRYDKRDFFKGDILAARFTPSALAPAALWQLSDFKTKPKPN